MGNKKVREERKNRSDQIYNALMLLGLMLLLALILVGVFGRSGNAVADFFLGVFGFSVYGYCFGLLAVGVCMLIGLRPRANRRVTLLYLAALLLVVAICHLVTAKPLIDRGLDYGDYLKECFRSRNTAGGLLGGLLFYFLGKAYVVSLVFLSLLLASTVALAVVTQLNRRLNFRTAQERTDARKKEKTVLRKKDAKSVAESVAGAVKRPKGQFRPIDVEETEQDKRSLYNATVDGRQLSNNIGRSFGGKPVSYTPLEEYGQSEEYPIPQEPIDSSASFLVDPQEVKAAQSDKQRAALDFLYMTDEGTSRPITAPGMEVNASRTIESIRGERNGYQPPQKPRYETPRSTDVRRDETQDLEDKYKLYSNRYRMEQLKNNNDFIPEESTLESTENDRSSAVNGVPFDSGADDRENEPNEDFLENLERVLNDSLGASDRRQPREEEDTECENKTAVNPEPLESIEEVLARREAEEKAKQIEERKKRMRELQEKRAAMQSDRREESKQTPSAPAPASVQATPAPMQKPRKRPAYVPPDVSCLRDYQESVDTDGEELRRKIEVFEHKMADNGVEVKVTNVVKGPTFSRIEFETNAQVNRISARVNDITMWLEVQSLRLLAPIPGKGCCGIEIPNDKRGTVGLKTIINSPEFNNIKPGGLFFALGKDIDGKCYVSDISKYPHGLVAGASGAGKSVCLNGMLCSMLYKYSPEDLRLILVDPKVVEFNIYRGLPHMLIPNIISEEKQVINALKWAIDEMERRYQMLMELSVQNITQYNKERPAGTEKLPYLLIVIDEVGDIILSSVGKEFETMVKRLAAKARAAGIHLILATQRPSVDIITGTIKSNLPTRIAFAVTSGVDSKTILDSYGAEKLLRMGDLLYKDGSVSPTPVRVQGAFIDNPEVRAIVSQVKERNESYFDDTITEAIMKVEEPKPAADDAEIKMQSDLPDTMCVDALEVGLSCQSLTISYLQRKLSLGFQRAARIMDWMKDMGYLVGEGKNAKFTLSEQDVEEIKRKENGEQ